MKVTYTEVVTRVITVDLPEKYDDMPADEIEFCDEFDEVRDLIWDRVDDHGWDTTYCHDTIWEIGEHEPTIYLKS